MTCIVLFTFCPKSVLGALFARDASLPPLKIAVNKTHTVKDYGEGHRITIFVDDPNPLLALLKSGGAGCVPYYTSICQDHRLYTNARMEGNPCPQCGEKVAKENFFDGKDRSEWPAPPVQK